MEEGMNPSSKALLAVAAIVVPIVVLFAAMASCESGVHQVDSFDAYYMATQHVKESLKAPSTADFSGFEESVVTGSPEAGYTVKGWVDAQNSFGAKLRSRWICESMKPTGQDTVYTHWSLGFCGLIE
jgi:hypothetical protein